MLIDINKIWCVIPVYNNASTLREVVEGCKQYIDNILVIDDGSNDTDIRKLLEKSDVDIIHHQKNLGKGMALRTAICHLHKLNAEYMITIDADGQHYPSDIPKFISEISDNDFTLVIGCRDFLTENIPRKSKFG